MTTADTDTDAIDLIGRDPEVRALTDRLDAASGHRGGALLFRGETGIGKTALLHAAGVFAATRQFTVLTTTGVQAESQLPFAGVHQLLHPVLDHVDRLPNAYRQAIRTAFGLGDQATPSPHLIAMSILHLLGEVAEPAPVLLLVDDAQWLDLSTGDALAFVARRLEADPIVLLGAIRDGFESPLLGARLPELHVKALPYKEAATLLDARAPALAPVLRHRILKEAAGNPLALIELSAALRTKAATSRGLSAASLPLTDRLVLAFADRLSTLSPGARCLLHVAAADEKGVLAEILSAASKLDQEPVGLRAAAEAGKAGFIEVDGPELRFRHPLMRAAILEAISLGERQAAHAALAETLDGDPDRRAWHRAAAVVGTSEQIAAELDGVALRAEHRGARSVALEAIERAAQLDGDLARRGNRLLHAADLAVVLGRQGEAVRLLESVDDMELDPWDRPRAAWLREIFGQGAWSGASRVASFVEIADRMREHGDIDRGFEALEQIALRCWWSNPDEQTRASVIELAERLPVAETDARLIFVLALAGPVERGAIVVDRLTRLWRERPGDLDSEALRLGMAAVAVGDFIHAERLLETHLIRCRAHGWLGELARTLVSQAWTKIQRGDWKAAGSMASEAKSLADETGQNNWVPTAVLATAVIAAYRGDVTTADSLASAGEQALLPRGADPMLALVHYPRGIAALADGRPDEAFHHLSRIFDPADHAYHPHVRSWALVDLVEAAVHSGHETEVAAIVGELEAIASRTGSPLLQAALGFARPLLFPDNREVRFKASLGAELSTWPFLRARLQLAYGLWLRRQRRAADARTPLRAARDAFDALGAVPWSERARVELRASGETSRRRTHDLTDALSPQELQIAQLAAQGLSNKEIGRQLFLSHRTIGSHLYRIFPKLGIAARSQLRAALQDRATTSSG